MRLTRRFLNGRIYQSVSTSFSVVEPPQLFFVSRGTSAYENVYRSEGIDSMGRSFATGEAAM
jgi:hypothetical protein